MNGLSNVHKRFHFIECSDLIIGMFSEFICKIYSGEQLEGAYFILCVRKKIGRFKSHYGITLLSQKCWRDHVTHFTSLFQILYKQSVLTCV